MDEIRNYIIRFFKRVEMRSKYDMRQKEWRALSEKAKEQPVDATGISFLFGYAKGYRAAVAEMKKGGVK